MLLKLEKKDLNVLFLLFYLPVFHMKDSGKCLEDEWC